MEAKVPVDAEGTEWGDAGGPPPFSPMACKGHRALPVPVTRPTLAEEGPILSLGFSLYVGVLLGGAITLVVRAFRQCFGRWAFCLYGLAKVGGIYVLLLRGRLDLIWNLGCVVGEVEGLSKNCRVQLLLTRSRGRLSGTLATVLGRGKCSISTICGKGSTLSCLLNNSCSYTVLSVVVPLLSKVSILGKVHRRKLSLPIVVLATGDRVSSEIFKLSDNTSSCIAGPFITGRLVTQVETIAHEGSRARSPGLAFRGVALGHSAYRLSSSGTDVELTGGRCRVLRVFVSGPERVVSPSEFVRGV